MAFMARNRRINGAADPSAVARSDGASQRAAEALVPNGNEDLGSPQHRNFEPNLETIATISERHKNGWKSDTFGGPSYEQHIPVGPRMP